MPSSTSRLPAVESCVTTGATATTWSSLRRRSATLIDTGAPLTPISSDEPGGCTMMSAPMPTWRFLVSLNMPMRETDDQQNQGDFNRDSHNADDGAEGTVHQVGKDHLIHDSLLIVLGCERLDRATPVSTRS